VSDPSDKKTETGVSVRIPQWVLDEVEEEIRRSARPRPTRGELIANAWRLAKLRESVRVQDKEESTDPIVSRWHALLDYVLKHGTSSNRNGVVENLDCSFSKVRSQGGPPLRIRRFRNPTKLDPLEVTCPICESNLRIADPLIPEVIQAKGFWSGMPTELASLVTSFIRLMSDQDPSPTMLLVRKAIRETLTEHYDAEPKSPGTGAA